jgi:hypothetical protein
MKRVATLLAISSMALLSVLTPDLASAKVPDRATLDGKPLVLNGSGIRTKLVFKVYVCSLYLPAKANTLAGVLAADPRRVQLDLLRNLSADDLAGALADGIKQTSTAAEAAAVKSETDQLLGIMKSIGKASEGDVVTMDYVNGETRIGFNGQNKGNIPGAAFNAALMRIWLADQPVQPDLRKAMLGI